MKLKMLALAVATTFAVVSAPSVMACSTTAWTGGATGSPVAGQPNDTTPTRRYSGVCGLRAPASGSFVTDNTPAAETVFRARFYVYTGVTGGNAVVFRAANSSDAPMITVTYDAAAGSFGFATTAGGGGSVSSIVANRWYSIELAWAAAGATVPSGVTAGVMTASVQGAGATSATTATGTMTVGSGDRIDTAQLGWISGTATPAATDPVFGFEGGISVDAYESRRATAVPRLCPGDANGDRNRSTADIVRIRNEALGLPIATWHSGTTPSAQPDANEDGRASTTDMIVVRNIVLSSAGGACP